jgi:hypothetical protein
LNVLRDWGALDISLSPKAFHYRSGYINSQRKFSAFTEISHDRHKAVTSLFVEVGGYRARERWLYFDIGIGVTLAAKITKM